MSDLEMAEKRSFVKAFLEEEEAEDCASKRSTRMELVRAKNRRDATYQSMLKIKERMRAQLAKLREAEAAYEAAKDNVDRLQARLKDD